MKWRVLILDMVTFIWAIVAMLRFLLQKGGLAYDHPLAFLLYQSTQWIVGIVRKIIPPVRGWDVAIPVSVFLVLFICDFLVLAIALLGMNINKSLMDIIITSNLLIVILKVFSAFIYAIWSELITWYFLRKDPKDIKLLRAIDVSLNHLLISSKTYHKLRLIVFVICTLWIVVIYPNITYKLQNYILL